MAVKQLDEPQSLLDLAGPVLLEHEAENCLLLGIARSLAGGPTLEQPLLLGVISDERVVGAAIRTRPFDLVLSYGLPADASPALVDFLHELGEDLPGVLGEKRFADQFAEEWGRQREHVALLFRSERIHQASEVEALPKVGGEARAVAETDRPLFEEWLEAFFREVGDEATAEEIRETADTYIGGGPRYQTFLWWDEGRPVSMASFASPTPNGALVRGVYTPRNERSKGYGSAVTAALTQHAFDTGRRLCYLFTDLANPTSNAIYHRIGYRPVCDMSHWRFSASGG